MQKYCIFSAQYLPGFGGVEQYTYNLSNKLRERGHEVIIVTSQQKDLPVSETQPNGVRIYRVPSFNFLNGRLPMALSSGIWKDLQKKLKVQNITRVIVQTRLYTLSVMGMKFAAQNHIPCITIEHGTSFVGMSNPIVQSGEILYEKFLLAFAKRYCHHFCTVSLAGSDWLKQLNLTSEKVLYNSVDEQIIQGYFSDQAENWRKKLGISDDTKIITFVGRLIREKGIVQLIDSVKDLQAHHKTALLIAGDGPLYDELKAKNVANVFLLGRLSQPDVMNLLRQSDFFCLPSDSEGFPTSVLEAIICKCYVVTAPYGGAKEIISAPEYGTVMQDNTKETITAVFDQLLSQDPKDTLAVTENAYAHFLSGFTWNHTCDALESLSWEI